MIVHHSIDYLGQELSYLYPYVRFVTGSFIFLTEFLISNILIAKYDNNLIVLAKRLFIRGLKIFCIFLILNILIKTLINNNQILIIKDFDYYLNYIIKIFISGSNQDVSFEILLPISYLLAMVGLSLYILRKKFLFIKYIFLFFFIYCLIHYFNMNSAYNFRYSTIGLFGFVLGFIPLDKYRIYLNSQYLITGVYFLHLIVISFWKLNFLLYNATVLANLSIIFSIALKLNMIRTHNRMIILIGQYSLISYIIQIAILQLLSRFLINGLNYYMNFILGLILVTILTYLSVEMSHILRKKSTFLDRLYKIIFQ
jgi:hypothetical protein